MKKLTMLLAVGLMLCGCASIRGTIGTSAEQDALQGVKVAITTYADIYQPAVILYGRLPACVPAGPVVCKDAAVFAKLKIADAAVTKSIVAAQAVLEGKMTDVGQITEAIQQIVQAEAAIAASGALTAPAVK